MTGILAWIQAGGWLLLPLVLCSLVSLAIMIERFIFLQRKRVAPAQLVDQALLLQRQGAGGRAAIARMAASSPLGAVLATGLQHAHLPPEQNALYMQAAASVQLHRLEQGLSFLGTLGYIAPLLGLLGTVIGIIEAFQAVQTGGVTDPAMLTTGLAKALITTAAGMVVAIPAMMGLRALQRRVNGLMVDMEWQASLLLQGLSAQVTAPAAEPPPVQAMIHPQPDIILTSGMVR